MVTPHNLVGKQIDQFRIDQFIARGAMGMVFKAFDTVLARTVALKLISKLVDDSLLPQEEALREEARKRLIQEAKAAGRLTHPNIVTVHNYGETAEFEYICMEYVSGKTLSQLLAEKKVLDPTEAITLFEQILHALEAANQERIVHRDIKPSNIMLTGDNRVKVMDFGIAKLPSFSMTVTGTVLGTPYYMSPEQITGQKVDIRSDIFSTGAVFYQALTGERPFEGQNTAALTYQIINVEPIPPIVRNAAVPDFVSKIAAKAMAKDPRQRYQTPGEMLRDLMAAKEVIRNAGRGDIDPHVVNSRTAAFGAGSEDEDVKTIQVPKSAPGLPPKGVVLRAETVDVGREPEIPKPMAAAPPKVERPAEPKASPAVKPDKPDKKAAPKETPVPSEKNKAASRIAGIAMLILLVAGVAFAVVLRSWNRAPSTSPPAVGKPQVQTPIAVPDTGRSPQSSAPSMVTPPPPNVPQFQPESQGSGGGAPQTTYPSSGGLTSQGSQSFPAPSSDMSPSQSGQQALVQPPPVTPPPPARASPPPSVPKVEGGYFVKGINPNGSNYRGTASIDRKGEQYYMTWKIAGQSFSGSGTLSGKTLSIKWTGNKGGGVVTYTVMPDGSLKGVWADGSATETLVPIH